MALAAAVGHSTRAVVEEVVLRMKVMAEDAAEGGLLKKLEYSVLVLVAWVVEGVVGWRMGGVVQAKEVEEADQQMGMMQLDLSEEAEGVR